MVKVTANQKATMTHSKILTATQEDYLEAIGRLVAREGKAHVKDIAEAVSVDMSSVTSALRGLSEKGLVNYSPYKAVTLTEEGQSAADRILRRHKALSKFLSDILLVDQDVAEENACRMEHVLDTEVMEHLSFFARFVRECPRAGEDWLDRFRYYLEHEGEPPKDEEKMKEWLKKFREEVKEAREGEEEMTTLDELDAGQKADIVKVEGKGALPRRIVDMGAVKGTPVEVVKVAPLGDPVEVKIRGYHLTLRKEEAAGISVKVNEN